MAHRSMRKTGSTFRRRGPRVPPDALAMPFAQRLEPDELILFQAPILIATDEDLEHHAAILVDELHRAGALAEEGPVYEIDEPAAIQPQMSADGAVAMNVEVAAAQGSGRNAALALEDAVAGMDHEGNLAPTRQILPDLLEPRAGNALRTLRAKAIQNGLHGNVAFFRDRFENSIRPCRKILPDQVVHRCHRAYSAAVGMRPMDWMTSKPSNSG